MPVFECARSVSGERRGRRGGKNATVKFVLDVAGL